MNLDKILQDAEEYEKIRDAATPGDWCEEYWLCAMGILVDHTADTNFPYTDFRPKFKGNDAIFIAAAKNYDCVSVIKSLVERVKDLENSIIHDVEIGYEYQVTDGPRKCWDGEPDLSKEGWEEYKEWERFQYYEERYWRRKKEPKVKP